MVETRVCGASGKESSCQCKKLREVGLIPGVGKIPGLGRSPGEGNGNPLQYSCLENPMDRGWGYSPWVANSRT